MKHTGTITLTRNIGIIFHLCYIEQVSSSNLNMLGWMWKIHFEVVVNIRELSWVIKLSKYSHDISPGVTFVLVTEKMCDAIRALNWTELKISTNVIPHFCVHKITILLVEIANRCNISNLIVQSNLAQKLQYVFLLFFYLLLSCIETKTSFIFVSHISFPNW